MWGGSTNSSSFIPQDLAKALPHGQWPADLPPYFQNHGFSVKNKDYNDGKASVAYHQMSFVGFSSADRDGALFWYKWSEWSDPDFNLTMRFAGAVDLVFLVATTDFQQLHDQMH